MSQSHHKDLFSTVPHQGEVYGDYSYPCLNQFSLNLKSVLLKNKIPTLSHRALKINLKKMWLNTNENQNKF